MQNEQTQKCKEWDERGCRYAVSLLPKEWNVYLSHTEDAFCTVDLYGKINDEPSVVEVKNRRVTYDTYDSIMIDLKKVRNLYKTARDAQGKPFIFSSYKDGVWVFSSSIEDFPTEKIKEWTTTYTIPHTVTVDESTPPITKQVVLFPKEAGTFYAKE